MLMPRKFLEEKSTKHNNRTEKISKKKRQNRKHPIAQE
jgi:hypothetical protein